MKTTRMISLLLALCFVLLLAGCGAAPDKTPAEPEKTPEDLATETVTGLMDSLVDGHPAEAKKFCAEEIWEAGLFDEFFDPEDPESAYEYMGISEENGISPELLNEETKDSVIRFIETYNDAMFQEYELKDRWQRAAWIPRNWSPRRSRTPSSRNTARRSNPSWLPTERKRPWPSSTMPFCR